MPPMIANAIAIGVGGGGSGLNPSLPTSYTDLLAWYEAPPLRWCQTRNRSR